MIHSQKAAEFQDLFEKFKSSLRERCYREAEKMKKDHKGNYNCPYCLKKTKKSELHADHIIPIERLGLSKQENMVLVCADCNVKKNKYSLYEFCQRENLDFEEISTRLKSLGKWV